MDTVRKIIPVLIFVLVMVVVITIILTSKKSKTTIGPPTPTVTLMPASYGKSGDFRDPQYVANRENFKSSIPYSGNDFNITYSAPDDRWTITKKIPMRINHWLISWRPGVCRHY